jgi:hypothetical protein
MKQVVATLLVLVLAHPASAGPIADSVAKAAKEVAAAQGPPPGSMGGSPRDWVGMTLVGTGLGFVAAGFANAGSGPNDSHDTTLGLIGAGMVGGGLALLLVGRGRHHPDVTFGAGRVIVRKTLRF